MLGQHIGQYIGQYRITRELGRGGMGIVYEAVHERIGQRIAVKTLTARSATDAGARDRFFREARVSVLIDHEGVPAVFDFGELADGTPYILMELLKGESLRLRLRRSPGGLPLAEALRIARQVGSALCAAHGRGIDHRDLKPENIILVADADAPGGGRAKILDFGIASLKDEGSEPSVSSSAGPRVLGTPAYMAPEQCAGQPVAAGGRGDVYALGCLLYELICGQTPFVGERDDLLRRQIFETPVPLRQRLAPAALSAGLDALVQRMLSKQATERPAMTEVVSALDAELGTLPPAAQGTLAAPAEAEALRGAATVDETGAEVLYPSDEGRGETVPPRAGPDRLPAGGRAHAGGVEAVLVRRATPWSLRRLGVATAAAAVAAVAVLAGTQRGLRLSSGRTVQLPGGTFTMGSTPEEIDAAFYFCQRLERDETCSRALFEREQPLRRVTLSPFAMDATEVTNERFARWLNQQRGLRMVYDEAHHTRWLFDGDVPLVNLYPTFPTYGLRQDGDGRVQPVAGYATRPVTQVTWLAAQRYCAAHGQRLPTEAEWEYAARPRPGDRFPWGSDPPRCDGVVFGRLPEQECAGRGAEPAPVGSSPQDRTAQGIQDLAGNVAEWVHDRFVERYPDCGGACADPAVEDGPPGPPLRVFRGGDWAQVAVILRSAGRGRWRQDEALQNVGFRCVSPR